ncbi:hypothetical protein JHK85_035804 [Glycine max]|nr:hypothetical protein JHK85_035804 [Glycine max]
MLEKVREFSVDKVIQEIELLTRDAERVHREPLKRILEDNQQSTCRVWVSMEALTVRISRHVFNENEDLKKIHEAHLVDFVLETTSVDDVQDTSICEEVKALLDEKTSRPRMRISILVLRRRNNGLPGLSDSASLSHR